MNHLNRQRDGLCWIVIVCHVQPRLTENRVAPLQHPLLRVPALSFGPFLEQPFRHDPKIFGLPWCQDAAFGLYSTLRTNANTDDVVHSPVDCRRRENVGTVQIHRTVNQRLQLGLQCVVRRQLASQPLFAAQPVVV